MVVQLVYLHQKSNIDDQLLVFHKSRNSIIGKKEGRKLQLFHNLTENATDLKLLQNYKVGENLLPIEEIPLKDIYFQKRHFLILLDSSGIIPSNLPENSHLLLTGSPRINLERILQKVQPIKIVADGSNFPSAVKRWRKTAQENDIPFHYTGEDGAYIIK